MFALHHHRCMFGRCMRGPHIGRLEVDIVVRPDFFLSSGSISGLTTIPHGVSVIINTSAESVMYDFCNNRETFSCRKISSIAIVCYESSCLKCFKVNTLYHMCRVLKPAHSFRSRLSMVSECSECNMSKGMSGTKFLGLSPNGTPNALPDRKPSRFTNNRININLERNLNEAHHKLFCALPIII